MIAEYANSSHFFVSPTVLRMSSEQMVHVEIIIIINMQRTFSEKFPQ